MKTFIKVLFALGVIAAGLTALRIWNENQTDYIEIYNDNEDFDDDFYI